MQTITESPSSTSTVRPNRFLFWLAIFTVAMVGAAAFKFWDGIRKSDPREIVVQATDGIPSYTAEIRGDRVPSEQFAAIMLGKTTTLAKETFVEVANGQIVEWILKVEDIRKETGKDLLRGEFSVPVKFVDKNRTANKRLRVTCFFPATDRDSLLALQKGRFVEVSGRLAINDANDKNAVIRNARIKGDTSER